MTKYRMQPRKRLGEMLVHTGKITPVQMVEMLRLHKERNKPLGQVLIDEGILTDEELTTILSQQLGIPHIWLRKGLVDPRIVHIVPKEKALQYQIIPMFRVHNVLTLAVTDPNLLFVFDEIAKVTGLEVQPVLCRVSDIAEAIRECYRDEASIDEVLSSADEADIELISAVQDKSLSEITEMAEGSPVINLTNRILIHAIRDGASDIHLEPQRDSFRVRVRIDGLLYELMSHKIEMHPAVVSRLKVMANLDIAERRLPQDGRIQVQADGVTIDLRFSSMPTIHGEKVVLRILDQRKAILDINKLGFDQTVLERFKALLKRPYGLFLACGPTGSGKTTSLYSGITLLNTLEKNIVTIEDPVEYQLNGINQNQVKDAIGLTFAKYLKHALRQDPDIIMVGEIRDRETADIAIQASLTGHLVLSTLHTNDSASAVTRLLEMGIEPYLISSALIASLSQRLVRTICPKCRETYFPPKAVQKELGAEEDKQLRLYRGKGCSDCYDSGFKGRIAIYELLEMDATLQSLILKNPTIDVLKQHLQEGGHKSLKDVGHEKVLEGITTIEEVRRATTIDT
ncbi:MAG: Flp pilus assembly complex ATPase component TadA [Deltaproteobacteria bacterium]|nr:Flp pilus assembly complex ATPase component TadA [Deltaproteobacteria bacterium]